MVELMLCLSIISISMLGFMGLNKKSLQLLQHAEDFFIQAETVVNCQYHHVTSCANVD